MPSVANLYSPGQLKWWPDADNVNAPDGVLLRADNMVPDRDGAMSLRNGSTILYSSLGDTGLVNSLYTAELSNGTTYRCAGADDTLYINGSAKLTNMNGSGDIAMQDDAYQIFFARGTDKKKWTGTSLNNWSLERPPDAVTLSAVTATTSTIADFNNSESPACTISEGSGTIGGSDDQNGTSNEATELIPDGTTYRGVIQRLWTTDQDYFTVSGLEGSETDLVDFYLKLENPRNVETIKVIFGLDDSSTVPFKDNRFEFEFNIKGGTDVPLKDLDSEGYAAYGKAITQTISGIDPQDVTGIQTPNQVKSTLDNVGTVAAPKSNAPADNIWSHLTVTRGQFTRIGNDEGRGWNTIRGFKVIYKTVKGKTNSMTISDAIFVGGGDRSLTGTYKCVYRIVREVKGPDGNVIYYEKSPPSPESDEINLNHQSVQITINGTILNSLDSQAEQIWIYLWGGWLDSYYRFAVAPAGPNPTMSIDELTTPAGSDLNEVYERARIPSWGFTYAQLNGSGVPEGASSSDLAITLSTTELEALTKNIRIEPYQIGAPDNIIDIAGPWNGRMFVLTSDGYVYPSNINDPSSFNSYQVIDLTRYGDPLWIAKTSSGVYVGCEKDIVFLQGDGSNSADLAQINLFAQPLNAGNPPIDKMHWREGNSVVYRSSDGLWELTGSSLSPLPSAGTSLLWRGQERHGISISLSGRFRCTVDNGLLYVLVPEGTDTSTNTIWRYSFAKQEWSRFVFSQVTSWKSIFNEPDGTLMAGDSNGRVWTLESGDQDNEIDIAVTIQPPFSYGGQPLIYKDPMDIQIHCDTGGNNAMVEIYTDANTDAVGTFTANTSTVDIWRAHINSIGKFIKAYVEITGNFNSLRIHSYNITYRPRPQRMVYLDAGYLTPDGDSDVVWLQEVEFDANCSEDFTMEVYRDDVLYYSVDVSPSTSVRSVNRIPVPRQTKGERLRIVFKSDTTSDSGDVGFDPYEVQCRIRNTGNEDFRPYKKLYPAGEAP